MNTCGKYPKTEFILALQAFLGPFEKSACHQKFPVHLLLSKYCFETCSNTRNELKAATEAKLSQSIYLLAQQLTAIMLGFRTTTKVLSQIQRSFISDLRFFALYVNCKVPEAKEWKQQTKGFGVLVPLNCKCGVSCSSFSKAFSSRASEEETKQSAEEEPRPSQTEPEQEDPVKVLYTFPNIKLARNVTKLKFFQTAVVVACTPSVVGAYMNGVVPYVQFMSSMGIIIFSTTFLYIIGETIRKVICILKYNKKTDEVIISHLTFFGRRRDIVLPVSKIVPVSDSSEDVKDTYVRVNTYDKSESFFLFINHATEEEKKELLKIIG